MNIDKKSWNEYYSKQNFSIANILLHYPYLMKIIISNPKRLLEIGCGPAEHSLFIKKVLNKSKISVLDSDSDLLKRVRIKNPNKIEYFFNMDILDKSKIETLPKFDLLISQGLMEHFSDSDFINIINEFSTKANNMIFSVPSDSYQNKDFGDEILRSKFDMERLLEKGCKYNFKVKNYPFDIGLKTKLNLIMRNRYSLLKSLSFLLFNSCHILVEIDYNKNRGCWL